MTPIPDNIAGDEVIGAQFEQDFCDDLCDLPDDSGYSDEFVASIRFRCLELAVPLIHAGSNLARTAAGFQTVAPLQQNNLLRFAGKLADFVLLGDVPELGLRDVVGTDDPEPLR